MVIGPIWCMALAHDLIYMTDAGTGASASMSAEDMQAAMRSVEDENDAAAAAAAEKETAAELAEFTAEHAAAAGGDDAEGGDEEEDGEGGDADEVAR